MTGERVFLFTSQTQSLHQPESAPHQRERYCSRLVPRDRQRILSPLDFPSSVVISKNENPNPEIEKERWNWQPPQVTTAISGSHEAAQTLSHRYSANSPDSPARCIATRIYNHVTIAYREPEHHYIASWNGKLPWSIVLLRAQWLARPARTIQGGSVCSVRRMLSRFASASQ